MNRKYLGSTYRRIEQNAKFERRVRVAGSGLPHRSLLAVLSPSLSVALSCAVLATVVVGAYYLFTGEFIFQ